MSGAGEAGISTPHALKLGFKTSPCDVDWQTLLAAWREAASLGVFDSGWLNDHLTDPNQASGGSSFESMTTMAALAPLVPGLTVGHMVLSNTFRQPSVLAKQATVMDHLSGGRFVLGLGAGWHEGEHRTLGIPLPPLRERFDRFESAIRIIRALFSEAAAHAPGVDLDAPPYPPLRGATNEPAPLRQGGPPLWLGVSGDRGLRIAARYADGVNFSAGETGSVAELATFRARLQRACDLVGRDVAGIEMSAQLLVTPTRDGRAMAATRVLELAAGGVGHFVLMHPARLGPSGIRALADEVVGPVRERAG